MLDYISNEKYIFSEKEILVLVWLIQITYIAKIAIFIFALKLYNENVPHRINYIIFVVI